jgi:hypothetical protein
MIIWVLRKTAQSEQKFQKPKLETGRIANNSSTLEAKKSSVKKIVLKDTSIKKYVKNHKNLGNLRYKRPRLDT